MSPRIRGALSAALLSLVTGFLVAAPASAQTGFGLKAHLVYNASAAETFEDERSSRSVGDFVGLGLGAEYVLPFGLGLGVTGQASGDPRDTDRATVLMVLAEANYHMNIPMLPITPFAGAHIGLRTFSSDARNEFLNGDRGDLDRARVGWQAGVRVQVVRRLSVEGMYRRLSARAESALDPGFEGGQVILGVRFH